MKLLNRLAEVSQPRLRFPKRDEASLAILGSASLIRRYRFRVAIILIWLTCSAAPVARSVRDGVYSKVQVKRGQAVYREECAKCHAENLTGGEGAPPLVGNEFLTKWQGKTVGDLFELIRKTMPSEDPGNLSRRQYADLVAYLLSANEFPAGEKELGSTSAALDEIRIELKR